MIPGELLRRIPGCEAGEPANSIQALTGGRGCNAVWRVETVRGSFVLRVRSEPVDRPGSVSKDELQAHRVAQGAGLAPALIDAAEDGRWLLMDHVAGEPWSGEHLQSEVGLAALGRRLRLLHALPRPSGAPRCDPVEIAQGYYRMILSNNPTLAPHAGSTADVVRRVAAELDGLSDTVVLNHGDLQAANMVGPRPLLVDWEYAQWTHPTYDVACLLDYYPAMQARPDALLAACGLDTPQHRRILLLQQRVFASLNSLWQMALGEGLAKASHETG